METACLFSFSADFAVLSCRSIRVMSDLSGGGTGGAWNYCSSGGSYACDPDVAAGTSHHEQIPLHHLEQPIPPDYTEVCSPPQIPPALAVTAERHVLRHEPSLGANTSQPSYLSHPPLLPEEGVFSASSNPSDCSPSDFAALYTPPDTVLQQASQLPQNFLSHQPEACPASATALGQTTSVAHHVPSMPPMNETVYYEPSQAFFIAEGTGACVWNSDPSTSSVHMSSLGFQDVSRPTMHLPAQQDGIPTHCVNPVPSDVFHPQPVTHIYDTPSQRSSNVWDYPVIPPCSSSVVTVMSGHKPLPSVIISTGVGPSRTIMDSANCPLHSKLGHPACPNPAGAHLLSPPFQSKAQGWIHTTKAVTGPKLSAADEEMERRKMRDFSSSFRTERLKLGYTQADVAQQLTIRYAVPVCEGKVSMFESASLSLSEMQHLKIFLEGWLFDTVRAQGVGEEGVKKLARAVSPRKDRKRRMAIDGNVKKLLEIEFWKNSRPSQKGFTELVKKLGVEREVVRTWFSNQRQKLKKKQEEDADNSSPGSPETLQTPHTSDNQDTSSATRKVSSSVTTNR